MSRLIYLFLFLLVFNPILTSRAESQEYLSGQILEVNGKNMEIVIASEKKKKDEINGGKTILIRMAKDNLFQKQNDHPFFPECVKPGNWIRIWGYWEEDTHNVMLASDIKGCADGGCSDPTGIMSRLKKMMGMPLKNSVDPGHGSQDNTGSSGSGTGAAGHGGGGGGGSGGSGGGGSGGGGSGGNGGGGSGGGGKS